ncbi:response regulator transcription factor [Clostridium amazonitimonense]|uniref:response regulator transcription factor n=1 Tax=Clostridium amazonitimonense TaxID=1499689 RepID=UPI000B1EA13C
MKGAFLVDKEYILIVDDEKEIRDLVGIYMKNEGYETIKAENGMEALEILKNKKIDLIILDVMMPKLDGIETCIKIREEKNIPIIMLSAKTEDMDKIIGLTTGADDYVCKPFNPLELIARVKSQLRRYKKLNIPQNFVKEGVIEIDDLVIDSTNYKVTVGKEEIKLTPMEFKILELLAENKNRVFSIEKIYERVWGEDYMESNNTVMVHIRKIREKIEVNPRKPRYLKTVWGVGYKIEE